MKTGLIAAAAVMLFAVSAVAFLAGYRIRPTNSETKSAGSVLVPSVVASPAAPALSPPATVPETVPSAPCWPATVPETVPSAPSRPATVPETVPSAPSRPATLVESSPSALSRPAAKARRAVTDVESYSMERRLLQPAQQAVARQDFSAALPTITEHQRRFPAGLLAEEREALRVKALLGLGRTAEAQRVGAAFRERFPHSAILERIDEMVGPSR